MEKKELFIAGVSIQPILLVCFVFGHFFHMLKRNMSSFYKHTLCVCIYVIFFLFHFVLLLCGWHKSLRFSQRRQMNYEWSQSGRSFFSLFFALNQMRAKVWSTNVIANSYWRCHISFGHSLSEMYAYPLMRRNFSLWPQQELVFCKRKIEKSPTIHQNQEYKMKRNRIEEKKREKTI